MFFISFLSSILMSSSGYLTFKDVYALQHATGDHSSPCHDNGDCNPGHVCRASGFEDQKKCREPLIQGAYRDPTDGICSIAVGQNLRVMVPDSHCGRTTHFTRAAKNGGAHSDKWICDQGCRTFVTPKGVAYGRITKNGFQSCNPLCSHEPPNIWDETNLVEPEYKKFQRQAHFYGLQ